MIDWPRGARGFLLKFRLSFSSVVQRLVPRGLAKNL